MNTLFRISYLAETEIGLREHLRTNAHHFRGFRFQILWSQHMF